MLQFLFSGYVQTFAAGMSLTVQGAMLAKLKLAFNTPFVAGWFSFTTGFLLVAGLAGVYSRRWIRVDELPPHKRDPISPKTYWKLTSGVFGFIVILLFGICIDELGTVVHFLSTNFGQTACSLLVDHVGFLGLPVKPANRKKLACAAFILFGLVLVALGTDGPSEQESDESSGKLASRSQLFFVSLSFLAGFLLPVRAALNFVLAKCLRFPIYATALSFLGGWLCSSTSLLVLWVRDQMLVSSSTDHDPLVARREGTEFPVYTAFCGCFGALLVFTEAYYPSRIGMTVVYSLVVSGTMAASLPFDHFGVLQRERRKITALRVGGVLIALIGTAVYSFLQRGSLAKAKKNPPASGGAVYRSEGDVYRSGGGPGPAVEGGGREAPGEGGRCVAVSGGGVSGLCQSGVAEDANLGRVAGQSGGTDDGRTDQGSGILWEGFVAGPGPGVVERQPGAPQQRLSFGNGGIDMC